MKTSYSTLFVYTVEYVEIICFIFFTCILNVAVCEEFVEVNVDNTPVEVGSLLLFLISSLLIKLRFQQRLHNSGRFL